MKISVITASFDSASTIKDTIESVLNQTYKDFELIIKDGGSQDETLAICNEYESRFPNKIKIVNCSDLGIYDAMNQGIAVATGDVVGILNSDDMYYDCNVLASIASAFEEPSIDCVYGDLLFVDEADTNKVVRVWKGSQYSDGGFRKGWHPAHPTFYAKKELFEKYGAFDTDLAVSADFELMLRFIEKYHANSLYVPCCMVKMRMGGESTGSIKNIIKGNKNILRAFKKNGIRRPTFYTIRRLAPKAIGMIKTKLGHK